MDEYLTNICNVKKRKILTKFRLSNHTLMIEKGRHFKLEIKERLCPLCQTVEDEIHFLIDCETYEKPRKAILERCTELKPQFGHYTSKEKFIFIMTSPLLACMVADYLTEAFVTRDVAIMLREMVIDKNCEPI